jgi:ATP-binding cassette subfamily C protein
MATEYAARRNVLVPTTAAEVGLAGADGTRRVDASLPWRCDAGAMAWRVLEGRVDVFWAGADGRGRRFPLRSFGPGEVLTASSEVVAGGATIALAIPDTHVEPAPVDEGGRVDLLARAAATASLDEEASRIALLGLRDAELVHEAGVELAAVDSQALDLTGDVVADAVRLMCESEGVAFVPGEKDPESALAVQVGALLRPSQARSRSIVLEGRWWTRDGDAFIGRDAEGSLIVVRPQHRRLPGGAGARYVAMSPATGVETPVDDAFGAGIETEAIVVQRVLPSEPVSARSLLATARRSWRREFVWTTILALGASLMTLLVPIVLGKIISVAVPSNSVQALIGLVLVIGCAAIGLFVFELTRNFTLLRLGGELDRNLLPAIWNRTVSLPTNFFRRYEVGDLTNRIMGVDQARQLLGDTILVTGLAAVFAVVNLIVVAVSVPALILPALGVILVFLIICTIALWLAQKFNRAAAAAQGERDALALQLVQGVAKIRVAGATATMFRRWAELMSRSQRAQMQAAIRIDVTAVAAGSLGLSASAAVYLAAMLQGDSIGIANFAVFATALGMATAAAGTIVAVVSQLGRAWVLIDRAEPILATPGEDHRGGRALDITGEITFTDLHFRYTAETPLVLQGLSLSIPAGSFTALVGASGCGKSTVLRCLLGFEQPERGAVLLDGIPLDELDLAYVRRQFGVVMQKFSLMGGSILDNIVGGRDMTVDEAWAAAEEVGLADFIRGLPMGMHTMLMDGAGTLSGGQAQRLLLARAVAGRPRLIILDEATSALDNPTQQIVTESLDRMSATRVVVAHRLSTVRDADQIAVVDAGRIIELGSHEELMALGGHYRDLVERQL